MNRIAREARPRIWVVVMHSRKKVEHALLTELCSANSEVLYQTYGLEAAAYYVDFSPSRATESAATNPRGANLCSSVLSRLGRLAS